MISAKPGDEVAPPRAVGKVLAARAATEATNQESRRLELKSDTSQDSSEEKVQWKRDFLKQAVANAGEQGGNEKPRKERTRKAAQSEQRRRIEIRER